MASEGMEVLRIDKKGIFLDSGLSPQEFARARMGQHLAECGYLLTPQKDEQAYHLSEFRFSNAHTTTQVNETETVLITAPAFAGKTLLSFLEGENQSDAINAVNTVCVAVEWALQNKQVGGAAEDSALKTIPELENCGPLGILIGEDNSVLFLPFAVFERSMLARDDEITSALYGCWTNTSLNKDDGWRFTLSVCAYTALTGEKPFSALQIERRTEDYYDDNFIPLEYCIPINTNEQKSLELAKIINYNLGLTSGAHQIIKPEKKKSALEALAMRARNHRSIQFGNKVQSIPLPLPIEKPFFHAMNTEFIQGQDKFIQKKTKDLKRKRFFRRHSTKISIIVILVLAIGLGAGSIIKTNLEKPTTEGMNPYEVVKTFYTALNTLDNILLESCGTNKPIKGYSTMVSSLFVTGKMREAYEQTISFLTPGQWLNAYNPLDFWVFGLTQVTITAKNSWNDIPKEGDTVNFVVQFYIITNRGLESYDVSAYTDELTLTYGKKYWQITDLSSYTEPVNIDNVAFRNDLTLARESINSDTSIEPTEGGEKLITTLETTYFWLPTLEEVFIGAKELPPYLFYESAVLR